MSTAGHGQRVWAAMPQVAGLPRLSSCDIKLQLCSANEPKQARNILHGHTARTGEPFNTVIVALSSTVPATGLDI